MIGSSLDWDRELRIRRDDDQILQRPLAARR